MRRERSATDRRKVLVRLCESAATARIAPIYEALRREMTHMITRYSTPELETIRDFCVRCIDVMRRQTEAVQALAKVWEENAGGRNRRDWLSAEGSRGERCRNGGTSSCREADERR